MTELLEGDADDASMQIEQASEAPAEGSCEDSSEGSIVTVVTIRAVTSARQSFSVMRSLTTRATASLRRVAGFPSNSRSTTTHAAWNIPLHPAAWEGLPPKPWQSRLVSNTHTTKPSPAASSRPGVRFPTASAA